MPKTPTEIRQQMEDEGVHYEPISLRFVRFSRYVYGSPWKGDALFHAIDNKLACWAAMFEHPLYKGKLNHE